MKRTSDTHPIRVDFISSKDFPILNQIGMTFAPGKKQSDPVSGDPWDRDVRKDVSRLREEFRADMLVSLIEVHEYKELEIEHLASECSEVKLDWWCYSIPDQETPGEDPDFRSTLKHLAGELEHGKKIVVHCKGGLGRAGTVAACLSIVASNGDISGDDAIKLVRAARPGTIENSAQEDFVRDFGTKWLKRRKELELLVPQMEAAEGEDVYVIGGGGEGACIRRFMADDGKWYYYSTSSTIVTIERMPNGEEREVYHGLGEPMESATAVLESTFGDGTIFGMLIAESHPDYEDELRAFAERRLSEIDNDVKAFYSWREDGEITVDGWLDYSRSLRDAFADDEDDDDSEDMTMMKPMPIEPARRLLEMSRKNFLLYWKFQSILAAATNPIPLDAISSSQLGRVEPGDRVWIVTIDGNGRLLVAGHMKIGRIVDRDEAVRVTGDKNLYDGDKFALPDPDEALDMINVVDIHHIAPQLRFGPDGGGYFKLTDGKINPQELQSMLELTQDSSALLYDEWEENYPFIDPVEDFDDSDNEDDFGGDDMFEDDEPTEDDIRGFIAECERALADNPGDVDLLYNLGVSYGRLGDMEKEADCYNRALIADPEYVPARFNLGCNFAHSGQTEKARDEFKILTDAGAYYPPAYFMMGTMEGHLGNLDSGIMYMKKGLEMAPDDPQAYFNLGKMYMEKGEINSALDNFEESIEKGGSPIAAHFIMGKCYLALGERRRELDEYLQALDIDGTQFDILFAAGTAWANIYGGEEGKEIGYHETGGELDLTDPLNHFYLGLGMLALTPGDSFINEAVESANLLRGMDPELAAKLDRLIAIRRKPLCQHTRRDELRGTACRIGPRKKS